MELDRREELEKELVLRGTAEISNGTVNQITQAIDEKKDEVEYLIFGELRKQGIISITEACSKCSHCHLDTVEKCQERQVKDARARGFTQMVCPEQFKD